jgi:hypothetical protein
MIKNTKNIVNETRKGARLDVIVLHVNLQNNFTILMNRQREREREKEPGSML